MTTHSRILTWRIPVDEENGGLSSMGSQRVGHDWATKHSSPSCYFHYRNLINSFLNVSHFSNSHINVITSHLSQGYFLGN